METIYLDRRFHPIIVDAPVPGDVHADPVLGDCRRLTAKRFCLAAERAGKESKLIVGLLRAIDGVAVDGSYDGRPLDSWYGLIGMAAPTRIPPRLVPVQCPECGQSHFSVEERGRIWNGGLCAWCWSRGWLAC